ncbi:MAG: hypothetical protein EHM35_16790, partial [Planctomycetaceae bacterium]
MDAINSAIVLLNDWGRLFCDFGGRIFIQSTVLVGLLLIVDLCLKPRVCARFRYAIWLLVLVKLVLPPSLALPTGVNYWLGRYLPATTPAPLTSPVLSSSPASLISPAPSAYDNPRQVITAIPFDRAEVAAAGRDIVPLQWPGLALLGWLAVVSLLSALVLQRAAFVRRSLRRSHPARQQMLALMEECRANLGVTEHVSLR